MGVLWHINTRYVNLRVVPALAVEDFAVKWVQKLSQREKDDCLILIVFLFIVLKECLFVNPSLL